MSHFLAPTYLLLLIPVALLLALYVVLQTRRQKFVARFSNVDLLGSVAPRRPGWRRHLTFALLLIALTVLSIGVAKPAKAVKVPRNQATVMLDIDVSLSMRATDVLPSRIEAAKTAGTQFVKDLPKTINLGLVAFAGSADLVASPTLDRSIVQAQISQLELRQSTAIGEAVFSSLQAIKVFTRSISVSGQKAPPAAIVLLSDGSNTYGRSIDDAITAAKEAKVRVSTIAFGTPYGTVTVPGHGTQMVPADDDALRHLATSTGGSFHTATSEQELRSVYRDIGSQIGYTTERRDISWRFLLGGLLALFAAGGASMLWSGRLV